MTPAYVAIFGAAQFKKKHKEKININRHNGEWFLWSNWKRRGVKEAKEADEEEEREREEIAAIVFWPGHRREWTLQVFPDYNGFFMLKLGEISP